MEINKKMKLYNFLDKHPNLKKFIVKPYRKMMKKYTTSEEVDYNKWIVKNEPTTKELDKQKKHKFKINPKISIVVPLYQTKEYFLKEIVACLKKQTYSNWELCLADGSPKPLNFIPKYLKDARIKYCAIGENKGISENTNEAVKLATGDYIGLLDHDDVLAPFALFEIVKAINEKPETEFFYSDEDRIESEFHRRKNMFFKPDFSKYTLRSANYICHFSVLKKELWDKLSGLRSEYDGSQDFDLVLRISEETDKIVHIPKILYHWRDHEASTAENSNSKPYAYEVAKKVIKDHFRRSGVDVEIRDGISAGSYEIQYLVKGNPKVALLVDDTEILEKAQFEKNLKNSFDYENAEIVWMNIHSKENAQKQYNSEIQKLNADYFMIIDKNFIAIEKKEWIQDLVGIAQNEDVGIVGTKLYNQAGNIEHCGIVLGMNGTGDFLYKNVPKDMPTYMQRLKIIHNVTAVYAKYAMIDKKEFEVCGGFDENYDGLLSSLDICLKMLKNKKQIVINPLIEFEVNALKEADKKQEQEIQFKKQWKQELETGDRFFSPNLSKTNTYLSINF